MLQHHLAHNTLNKSIIFCGKSETVEKPLTLKIWLFNFKINS
jgi:hypothetical protein